ncbi:MAG: hypothetical protein HUU57_04145 [Bdellovibrio sp.]|nr:hypothetical protein [Bdellovibrio sp.]
MKNIFFSVLMGFFLVSCSKENSSTNTTPPQGQPGTVVELSNKSTSEVLATKYNKAELKCTLWAQGSQKVDLSLPPTETVTLDLMKDIQLPHEILLKTFSANHDLQLSLKITKLSHYGVLDYTDANGKVLAKFSPYVEIDYSHTYRTTFEAGRSSVGSGSSRLWVNEKIYSTILDQSIVSGPDNNLIQTAIHDYATCVVATDIKPEYQDQFVFKPAK